MTKCRRRASRIAGFIGLATIATSGCSVISPQPSPLYPDGPELAQSDAAIVSLLAFPDVPRAATRVDSVGRPGTEIIPRFSLASLLEAFPDVARARRIAWASTEIVPQFSAESLGEPQLSSTWITVMPPGEYVFRFRHPCEPRTVPWQNDEGQTMTVTMMRTVYVDVPVTLEPGRFYRAVFEDRPGVDDFEVRETSEENALRFASLGQLPRCDLDSPDVIVSMPR